jgi:hypothetical protein
MAAYAVPTSRSSSCPCSRGAIGGARVVGSISDLVRSTSGSTIAHWPPDVRRRQISGLGTQLLWVRKFVHVQLWSSAAFPSCIERIDTLARPCEIPQQYLLRPVPQGHARSSHVRPQSLNLTRTRSAFWMAFEWSRQYAHWVLEHLPRLWYYLQLCQLLPNAPPVIITPAGQSGWQAAVMRALPTMATARGSRSAQLLALDPPQHFSSLYVPGMLSHIGILWTPQALLIWDSVRQLAARRVPPPPPTTGASGHRRGARGGAARLYSLRTSGGRSAGGARILADWPALTAGLRAAGFSPVRLDGMSLAQKLAALSRAESLVVECGSSLANAMLLPRGLQLVVLCMREHTSSAGCYGQLLASRFTGAAVHTLRVGEPLDRPDALRGRISSLNVRNNVQPHAAWTLDVPHALHAITALLGDSSAVAPPAGATRWPVPRGCERGRRHASNEPRPDLGRAALPEWWRAPEEAWRPQPDVARTIVRSRVFSLVPCTEAHWAMPRCWELRRARQRPAESSGGGLEWRECPLSTHCPRWRWCVGQRTDTTLNRSDNHRSGAGVLQDRFVDCEQRGERVDVRGG